jgi:hypothetical protein
MVSVHSVRDGSQEHVQVSAAIARIGQVIQKSAAAAEEGAAAGEELSAQAESMRNALRQPTAHAANADSVTGHRPGGASADPVNRNSDAGRFR